MDYTCLVVLRGFKIPVQGAAPVGCAGLDAGLELDARANTRSRWASQLIELRSRTDVLARPALCSGRWEHRVHAPFLRLSRLLGPAAVACRGSAQRVRQRHRVTGVATSTRRARTTNGSPLAGTGRSRLPRCARPSATAAAAGAARNAPDTSALAPRAGSTKVGAAAREAGPGRRSILRCESWSCGSPARIRAGDTRGSPVSY